MVNPAKMLGLRPSVFAIISIKITIILASPRRTNSNVRQQDANVPIMFTYRFTDLRISNAYASIHIKLMMLQRKTAKVVLVKSLLQTGDVHVVKNTVIIKQYHQEQEVVQWKVFIQLKEK
jgi:hypothetical protein